MKKVCIECIQNRTLLIRRQQRGGRLATLTLLLRQQLVVVLHDGALHTTFYFRGQAGLAVKALSELFKGSAIDQPIKRVVVVATQQGFAS